MRGYEASGICSQEESNDDDEASLEPRVNVLLHVRHDHHLLEYPAPIIDSECPPVSKDVENGFWRNGGCRGLYNRADR